jgi:hypothetical protein
MRRFSTALAVIVPALLSGCVFTSKAKDYNNLASLDRLPATYMTTTKIGLNLLVIVPFMGDMGISGLVRDMTADIKEEGGDEVRIVQGGSENYWYGWPPFTWIVTPVISTVAAEFIPSAAQHERDQTEIRRTKEEGGEGRWYKPWTW